MVQAEITEEKLVIPLEMRLQPLEAGVRSTVRTGWAAVLQQLMEALTDFAALEVNAMLLVWDEGLGIYLLERLQVISENHLQHNHRYEQ